MRAVVRRANKKMAVDPEGDMNDVIIVGGSFAGLSTAYFTEANRILVLEKQKKLGLKQRSTCCTSLEWLKKLKCERSILKTFDTVTFHSSSGNYAEIDLPTPFSTIDYRVFCESLAGNLKNAEVITGAHVLGMNNGHQKTVFCRDGDYRGEIVVDCSGWRAVVASHLTSQRYMDKSKLGYGIESEVEYGGDTSTIHIYYGKRFIKQGYAWIFPTGDDKARIGLGGYHRFDTRKSLENFMEFLGVKTDNLNVHGGAIPCFGLRKPIVEDIFIVGDAGGQVLPRTAEGIRKSFYYGEICGRLITRVLKGELGLSEALEIYKKEVYRSKRLYDNLYFSQKMAAYAPDKAREMGIRKLSEVDRSTAQAFLKIYLDDALTASEFTILKKLSGVVL